MTKTRFSTCTNLKYMKIRNKRGKERGTSRRGRKQGEERKERGRKEAEREKGEGKKGATRVG